MDDHSRYCFCTFIQRYYFPCTRRYTKNDLRFDRHVQRFHQPRRIGTFSASKSKEYSFRFYFQH
ncbi:ORF407 [White spot syndrome virus]|uniref:Wsv369 n=3 Tax=White spot syndrome virus TaxID=342409 RepID=Q8VAN2_WSSVS|nr:wsv369 [Shrimp white spot syndrome virus]AFX59746.1 wsv369 [White spot syndrome virus]AAL33371.1 wsv369 [Shrimp white spot syndrome virus]AAL89296.1 WSSV428 [Shrimp white spot syndrome virus]ATU84138.1 ORF407 [White spot syndrome virus]AWQ60495.1 wsv369 [Shrimp white spot syndrome virus]